MTAGETDILKLTQRPLIFSNRASVRKVMLYYVCGSIIVVANHIKLNVRYSSSYNRPGKPRQRERERERERRDIAILFP